MTTPPARPTFYSVSTVAEMLGLSSATLYRAIHEDAFPAIKIRGRFIVPAAALDALIEAATVDGGCVDVQAHLEAKRIERMGKLGTPSWR